ncbi:MAG: COX15/CtaA family protein [Geminicoccaceae bacterium]
MRAIRAVAGTTAVCAYALIVLGAVVRSTNSGLSCPDWPSCYGHMLPLPGDIPAEAGYAYWQVMLEWVHRLIAGVAVGPLVLVLVGLTWMRRQERPILFRAGLVLLALLLIQGILGGVTVLDRNSPWSVALHLGNALLVLSTILFVFVRSGPIPVATDRGGIVLMAALAWVLALAAMITAAITAKTGSSLACTTWPLCDGALVPDLSDGGIRIHFAHRVLAGATALAVIGLFLASRHETGGVRSLATAAVALVVAQVGLGASVILLEAPVAIAVTHQAVGVLTFAMVTLLLWHCLPLTAPSSLGGGSHGLALRGT